MLRAAVRFNIPDRIPAREVVRTRVADDVAPRFHSHRELIGTSVQRVFRNVQMPQSFIGKGYVGRDQRSLGDIGPGNRCGHQRRDVRYKLTSDLSRRDMVKDVTRHRKPVTAICFTMLPCMSPRSNCVIISKLLSLVLCSAVVDYRIQMIGARFPRRAGKVRGLRPMDELLKSRLKIRGVLP